MLRRCIIASLMFVCLSVYAEEPPGTPSITAPSGSGNTTTPEFNWTNPDGATVFDLWLDDLTTNTSQVIRETNLTGTTFTPATALTNDHSFRAWIRAANNAGFSGWSAPHDFATGSAPAAAPTSAPTVTGPNGSGQSQTPTFTWTQVSGGSFVDLQVDDLTTNSSQVILQTQLTGLSFDSTVVLTNDHSYRAWVRAGNVFGYGPWSASHDFGVGNAPIGAPTAAPTVTSPTASGNTTTPTFQWTTVADAAYFDLWIDNATTNTSEVIRQQTINGTSFTPVTALTDNQSYRIWVRAGNVFGYGPWSTEVHFGTGTGPAAPPTGTPSVTAPTGSGNTTTPALQWTAVVDGSFYELQVDNATTNTADVIHQQTITDTTFTPGTALTDNQSYRVWVRAGNVFGYGPWSAEKDFGVGTGPAAAPTTAPTITLPAGSGNTTTPDFAWSAVQFAEFYDLWTDDLTTGTSQVIRQQNVPGTTFTPLTAITDNHSYRTWVRAGNVFGYGPWSASKDFATGTAPVAPPAGTPAITAPQAVTLLRRPPVQWSAVADTSFYDLWIDDVTTNTSQVIRQQTLSTNAFTPTSDLALLHTYRAWVRAGNVFGYGPWSAASDFLVMQPDIVVSENDVTLNEDSTTTITVRLGSQPAGPVSVIISEPTLNTLYRTPAGGFTFDNTTWDTPQTLTIGAIKDTNQDDEHTTLSLSADGFATTIVQVTVKDTDTPAGMSPLVRAPAFDAARFSNDPDYKTTYLATTEPGRVWQSADPGTTNIALKAVGSKRLTTTLAPESSVNLSVTSAANSPVTFFCTGDGSFSSNGKNVVTVQADAQGQAAVSFKPGSATNVPILVASPLALGQVRFLVRVNP